MLRDFRQTAAKQNSGICIRKTYKLSDHMPFDMGEHVFCFSRGAYIRIREKRRNGFFLQMSFETWKLPESGKKAFGRTLPDGKTTASAEQQDGSLFNTPFFCLSFYERQDIGS